VLSHTKLGAFLKFREELSTGSQKRAERQLEGELGVLRAGRSGGMRPGW
jgi:hypothetical protein